MQNQKVKVTAIKIVQNRQRKWVLMFFFNVPDQIEYIKAKARFSALKELAEAVAEVSDGQPAVCEGKNAPNYAAVYPANLQNFAPLVGKITQLTGQRFSDDVNIDFNRPKAVTLMPNQDGIFC